MAYTTVANVRLYTNLTTSDINDSDITSLIAVATAHLNSDVSTKVTRERILPIDNTRENKIDGSNTTFYLRASDNDFNYYNWFGSASKLWHGKYIADINDDGTIDTDDLKVIQVASDGTETTLTVSSITHDEGKFVLSSAPSSGVELYVSYRWSKKDMYTPSELIEQACTYLTAALAFEKINRGLSPQQVYGNVRLQVDMQAGNHFYQRYREMINKINSGAEVRIHEAETF